MKAERPPRRFLPWIGRACRRAREERGIHQVQIAADLSVNQATVARFEDGTSWPRRPEEVLMAYASELGIDVRLLWLHGLVLWLENDPGHRRGKPGGPSGGDRAAGAAGGRRRSGCSRSVARWPRSWSPG